ncbi:pectinesterase family protein, partial [Treponema sp.]|uniref:pectinesterase family protein n=1 Tax=Treponema sp. TaxID=166 RepID=UPI00388D8C2B
MKKLLRSLIAGVLAFGAVSALSSQSRKADVWDFGGIEEDGASNHISVSDIDNLELVGADGKIAEPKVIEFGDLSVSFVKNDRMYYSGKKNYGNQGYVHAEFEDGYLANGIWYCNGKGGEKQRYLLLKNVKAGDVVTFYARISNSGDEKIHFASVDSEGLKDDRQDEVAPITNESAAYSYIALYSGSYKVYCEANVGKPVYYRIMRTPAVEVSGSLTSLPAGNAELKFVIKETNQELSGTISGKSYKAFLPAGFTYTAVLTGIKGYGVSPLSKQLVLDAKTTKPGTSLKKDITIAEQKTFLVNGKITGFASNFAPETPVKLVLTPPKKSVYMSVETELKGENGEFTYEDLIEPSVTYTATLSGANDYEITGDAVFEGSAAFTKDITVSPRKTYDVSGKFFGEITEFPKTVQFKNMEDGYIYNGRISTLSYSVELREGTYEVICETSRAKSVNHIVVNKNSVIKDIKLSLKEKTIRPLPLKRDLYVGTKRGQYPTVLEAVAAAKAMNPLQERDRITIHITPGVYRNQLIIDVPYITLKNDDPAQEVKLTWYYGIGYNYYSADQNGWYDEDLAYDKFSKKGVAKWGAATYVKSEAKAFRAEGITFETSFNKYVTDEEIADGVEMDGSFNFARKLNSDVRAKAATERSSAILIEADETEFLNCKFLGSQDTLYTGSGIKGYLRKCFIEGNTDFIFGDGDFVFENCEIRWAGYTDKPSSGYITAARTSPEAKGYLFYNCLISNASDTIVAPGYFGRPWGKSAAVAWVNTVLGSDESIGLSGWTDMSGNKPENARFREINTTWSGNPVDTKERVEGTIPQITKDYNIKHYLGQWNPEFYTEAVKQKLKVKKPSFTTDDDINTPYPGHTITVHYTLGKADTDDMSLIKWYRDKDGKSELIKQSTGYADKTYLIQRDDSGAVIRCLVIPQSRSGDKASPVEAKLDKKVNEGYAVPANSIADRARVNGAVNVFLASDSTCKDYSALGMWNGGQVRNEGAWGEFLQAYFNGAVAVQNYANGGRSCRNFINEGTLDKIEANISKGDYLFIQFGHNDCSNSSGYLEDRYVPLGRPDKKGNYPVTPGKKVETPASYASKYGATFYSYDCGGTYKWYLKQYIDVARKVGAVPVLVTPVSRQYFTSEGKIRPHHDSTDTSTNTQTTENNAYVTAVRQLAKEEKVILIDGFELTKNLYEKAFADKKDNSEAKKLMFEGDSTHNNKLGGF